MPLFLWVVRLRRISNGADFVLDRIEAPSASEAEEIAHNYMENNLDLRRSNYTAHAELKQEIMEG